MTNNEFKAWFEGFSENINSAPTPTQWEKIAAKVRAIDNVPIFLQVVYRDRWYPNAWPYNGLMATNTIASALGGASSLGADKAAAYSADSNAVNTLFNMGKNDFEETYHEQQEERY